MSKFLEIGPGRGDFLFFLAQENPLTTVVGVEYKRKRFDKLVLRAEKRELKNVEMHWGDARLVLPEKFEDRSFDKIFILFSDPWPKRRHAHHRLFQAPFVEEILRLLKSEGTVYVAHDDPAYVQQIKAVFAKFVRDFVFCEEGVEFTTFYAEKWKKEGRQLASFSYRKIDRQNGDDSLAMPCALPS